jgi:hypothetical protein
VKRNDDHLVTINVGMGRDSLAMLCLLVEGALVVGGEVLHVDEVDAVIFSDTGAEWDHTYVEVPRVRAFCERHGLRFLVLAKPADDVWRANQRAKGERTIPAWVAAAEGATIEDKAASGAYHLRLPIIPEFMRFAKIAVTVNASCTENHKVGPIRRCIEDLAVERFGVGNREWGLAARLGLRPRHEVLIGIAADEASRAIDTGRPSYEQVRYPLVEMGIDKAGEAAILARHGFGHVRKSGCVMCPYQGTGWFWALRETDPDRWAEVVAYEAAALAENPRMWVIGRSKLPLPVAVELWRKANPSATVADVLDKAYSRCSVVDERQLGLFPAAGVSGIALTPGEP